MFDVVFYNVAFLFLLIIHYSLLFYTIFIQKLFTEQLFRKRLYELQNMDVEQALDIIDEVGHRERTSSLEANTSSESLSLQQPANGNLAMNVIITELRSLNEGMKTMNAAMNSLSKETKTTNRQILKLNNDMFYLKFISVCIA